MGNKHSGESKRQRIDKLEAENRQLYREISQLRQREHQLQQHHNSVTSYSLIKENERLRMRERQLQQKVQNQNDMRYSHTSVIQYTHVDKLISYCKLLERVLEEHFNVELTEEEKKHKGLGVMINRARYQGNPLAKNMKDDLWKIVRSRNKLSHDNDVDHLEASEMRQVDGAWTTLQNMFQQRNIPQNVLFNMTALEKKYRVQYY